MVEVLCEFYDSIIVWMCHVIDLFSGHVLTYGGYPKSPVVDIECVISFSNATYVLIQAFRYFTSNPSHVHPT